MERARDGQNLPGAAGSGAGDRVAKSGWLHAVLGANGAVTINPSLQVGATFDLAPVARLLVMPSILAVNNDLSVKSVQEQIARQGAARQPVVCVARGRDPAAHRRRAVQGVGECRHRPLLSRRELHRRHRRAGTDSPAKYRVILPTVCNGQLRGLAVTSLERSRYTPDLPTIAESGMPGFEATSWTPPD